MSFPYIQCVLFKSAAMLTADVETQPKGSSASYLSTLRNSSCRGAPVFDLQTNIPTTGMSEGEPAPPAAFQSGSHWKRSSSWTKSQPGVIALVDTLTAVLPQCQDHGKLEQLRVVLGGLINHVGE